MAERESASGSSVSSGSRVPTVPGARSVVMSCHDTEMRVQFVGDDLCPFPELKRCYYDGAFLLPSELCQKKQFSAFVKAVFLSDSEFNNICRIIIN
jgi:hypothetical protein